MQPQFKHVPPSTCSFSTSATLIPSWLARIAGMYPPFPLPMMTRSNLLLSSATLFLLPLYRMIQSYPLFPLMPVFTLALGTEVRRSARNLLPNYLALALREGARLTSRMQPRIIEDLVRVYVADAGDNLLVQE